MYDLEKKIKKNILVIIIVFNIYVCIVKYVIKNNI